MSKLAVGLLEFADTAPVASALLEAGLADLPAAKKLVGLTNETAKRALTAGYRAALTVAQSTDDADLLDRLARSARSGLQVRRAVAANPATRSDTIAYLYEWAAKRPDVDCLAAAAARSDAPKVLDDYFGSLGAHLRVESVADAVANSGDGHVWRRALAAADPTLRRELLVRLSIVGPVDGLGVCQTIGELDEADQPIAIAAIAANSKARIDRELAQRMVDTDDWQTAMPSAGRDVRVHVRARLDPAAASVFARSGDPALEYTAAAYDLPPAERAALLAAGHPAAVHCFAARHRLTAAEVETICARPDCTNAAFAALARSPELPSRVRIAAARRLDAALLAKWFAGAVKGNRPRPGEMAAILADRTDGHALVRNLLAIQRITVPGVDEVVDHCPQLLSQLEHRVTAWYTPSTHKVLGLVFERLAARLGDDPARWAAALSFAPSWEGSLAQLCDTVCVMVPDSTTAGEAAGAVAVAGTDDPPPGGNG